MSRWQARLAAVVALALVAGAIGAAVSPAVAATGTGFPSIRAWGLVGAFKDSSNTQRGSVACLGSLGPRPDSLVQQPRTLSLRFLRDRKAESRPDFAGYRIYRMINTPDTSSAVLLRRYSLNSGSELSWGFSRIDSASGQFICKGGVVNDSVVTFVDPDSSGDWVKVCRRHDASGRCTSPNDSVFVLVAPPGPHDGFRTYYTITYEGKNGTEATYEDMFVPDSSNAFALCDTSGWGKVQAGVDSTGSIWQHIVSSCPNLNNKARNLIGPIEPTAGPTTNLETVGVVPNPYRAGEVWDATGKNEIHFINLPQQATIKIYTVSGDLVRELHHNDAIRDFEIWDLNSGAGKTVASGIYIYRVTAASYSFQNRFVVIR
jgi:hypothetical protein